MSTEPKCHNCNKAISEPGHVYRVFYPFLFVALAFPPGGRFCESCATIVNLVGFFVSFFGAVVLLGFIFWQLGQ